MLPADFISEVDSCDLPSEPLRCLAAQIGIQSTMKVWDLLRGRNISFPMHYPKKLIAKWLRKQGKLSITEAAWKIGMSDRTISKIANAVPAAAENKEGQLSLF
jgi:hypothetical protein